MSDTIRGTRVSDNQPASTEELRARVMDALRGVIDPEVGLDVVALGLVYGVDVEDAKVRVRMTMTTAACPLAEQIVRDAEERVRATSGAEEATVELVWEPPWTPHLMAAEAKTKLGWPM
jgi:metal-sulfur cluster biosynthetic enzyme